MPTVSYSCPDTGKTMKKSFPYNAVGKAQAHTFAKTMGGSMKNNPNKKMTEMQSFLKNITMFGASIALLALSFGL